MIAKVCSHKLTPDLILCLIFVFLIPALSCFTPRGGNQLLREALPPISSDEPEYPSPKEEKKPKGPFHQRLELTIPITHQFGQGSLRAEIYRPTKKALPVTVIIMVPGSGNVSRRGEIVKDGVEGNEAPIEMSVLWAKALAEAGLFVLSYDKRTCSEKINPICQDNDQKDIDQLGIKALANDLDQVFKFVVTNLIQDNPDVRLVLMSTAQGAQTIISAECQKIASATILLSPIFGNLKDMYVDGLNRAAEHAKSEWQKKEFLERKESMAGFFNSLENGAIPETATVKGATARFWLSWLEASIRTIPVLEKAGRPVFLLFLEKDMFKPNLIALEKVAQTQPNFKVETYLEGDRNFVTPQGVPKKALRDVRTFIDTLPAIPLINPNVP